ncbi:family 78 glycoside hydrolase catalytic domain [Pseudarthrobacter enclensis]|uniref:family 78 glycoside hydrolase catalytic domain n=1 Tax=Pseudarthrobacter enclensis TaxID=993070 RepID=UPI003418406E
MAATAAAHGALRADGLMTDGLTECLTATVRPAFSWQLCLEGDPVPAASRQSGYELAVRDAGHRQLWTSGDVPSTSLSEVTYGGAALDGDADYAWRVRVRDGAGVQGSWSRWQPFSTGPTDTGWEADWIRRAPGGRAPLEILDNALRVAGSPALPLPCPPVRSFRLEARLRPAMGRAGLLLRGSGPGTGLLLELDSSGSVLLRRAPAWDLPAAGVPDTAVLARAQADHARAVHQERLPGKDLFPGSWQDLLVTDDGQAIRVSLDGVELLAVEEPLPAGASGLLALHQGPRSQAEYACLRIEDGGTGAVLLDHRFDAGEDLAHAALAHWPGTTAHRQPDEWTLFRTTVRLAGPVRRARLYAAANHHAQLSIANAPCLGMTSFGYPGEGYYDAADVTGILTAQPAGKDIPLAALLHWYGPGQGRAAGLPGLLVRLSVDYADGRRDVFGSHAGWRAAEGPYRQSGYRNDEGDPVEHLDGPAAAVLAATPLQELPPAISCGSHPTPEVPRVRPRRTRMAERFVAPRHFLTADDGTLVADFGQVLPGRPAVDFLAGVPGRTVMIRAGYTLGGDGRVDTGKTPTQNTDMSFPYTQSAGPQQYRASVHLGFRYLELPGVDAADVSRLGAVVVHGEHPAEGSFSSSDPTLDAVFGLLRDSALYGVQEQFVDTPTREKGQFLADAVNISYATMALFGEHAYTAQALREFGWSAARYWTGAADRGRYNAVYPNGDGKRDIPDFSLMLPEWAEEYFLRTGDLALVRELLPHLCDTADYALRYIPAEGPTAGLVTRLGGGSGPYLHGIVDWPAPGRFGYDMDSAAKTTVNVQACSALLATARLCAAAGQDDDAARYAGAARTLAGTIRTRLRVGGVMVDGLHEDGSPSTHASQHATSFPLSLGITDPQDVAPDAARLARMGMRQGPLTVHRLVRALLAGGLTDAVLDLFTSTDQPGWARLLDRGATFTWEAWDLVDGTDYSQSHAWSASVIKEILDHLLGVRFLAPGGGDVLIQPPLCRLEHARGAVPAGAGAVSVDWRRRNRSLELECTVPAGVTATVRLPAGTYRVKGPVPGAAVVPVPADAGTAAAGGDGSTAGSPTRDFRVHPGSWSFAPEPD